MKRCYSDHNAIIAQASCLTVYRELPPSPRGDPTVAAAGLVLGLTVVAAIVLARRRK